MPFFSVQVTRETTENAYIEVEAANKEEAEALAIERSADDDFYINWNISDTEIAAKVDEDEDEEINLEGPQ